MDRQRAVIKRLIHLSLVLAGISILTFSLLQLLPGDTAEAIAAASGDTSAEVIARLRQELGLDQPLYVQYFNWLGDILRLDLGQSYRTGQNVSEMIISRLPVTVEVLILVVSISLLVAVPVAMQAARFRGGWFDQMTSVGSFALQSLPPFLVALVMIVVFAVWAKLLPAIGFVPLSKGLWPNLRSLTIPVIALCVPMIPLYVRVLRNEMIRTLQEDFILVARAQGMPPRKIMWLYALKPSLPTLVTVVGVSVGTLISGTIVVEMISGLPGMGTLIFGAISSRDYVVVQGVVLFMASAYVLINFLVDLVIAFLDPRVNA